VAGAPCFFLGAADSPIDPPPGWMPASLAGKVESGAQFAQTQFCMDIGVVRRYVARLAEAGLADKLFLLIGVTPLRSAKSALWMKQKLFGTIIPDALLDRLEEARDPAAEGRQACLELIAELAETPGVAGVHVMAPGNETAVPTTLGAARLALRRERQSELGQCFRESIDDERSRSR